MAETIHPVSISEETRHRYLHYALSVIQSRALPDVRDGLKPVQRRMLYTMYQDLHLYSDAKPRKCAKIIGEVIGNYHPHSPEAAYDALVRMAQNWVMRAPLVTGQGNFGSVEGDSPAAFRYTEAKLSAVSERLMAEMKQKTVDFRPNFDNTREEPVVLPAQFPNLLVNGTSGIAVGLASNIPPHNLAEVIAACITLIEDPDATTATLLNKMKGPDFPLGGKIITDRPTLRRIYEEGSGSIKIQGEWRVETPGPKSQIVITSIPYGVNRGNLEAEIGAIVETRKLPQLLGVHNESDENTRIVLEMKQDADPAMIMAYLYKHTALQQNFAYNMTCLVPSADGIIRPERLGLKPILQYFNDFRFATVKRRFEYDLEQLRKRIHILEGFRIIFNALDEAIRIIRTSEGKADAAEKLIKRFKLDEIQANAILEAQLYRIAQMEIKKILDELREKKAEAERIEGILKSKSKLWGVVKSELSELAEKFGDKRRSRVATDEDVLEFNEEAYIVRENTNIVVTRDGWIKRVGRLASIETTRVREGDSVLAVVPASTLDTVVFFADDGAAYTMRVNEVPASSGYGEPVTKFFKLGDGVRLVAATTGDSRFIPESVKGAKGDPPGPYLITATKQGLVSRLPYVSYRTESTKVGRRFVRLNDGDKVVLTAIVGEETSLFLASAEGHVIHFEIAEIPVLSSAGKGVLGIKLNDGDECLGGALIGNRHDACVVETSGGKTHELRRGAYTVTHRGGKGFEVVKRSRLLRVLPAEIELVNWEEMEEKDAKRPGRGGKGLYD
ncbi:MAG: DNA topoisomerase 4 subunit A [Gemmataceae bacterium]|nr:DNA topoisomerase 4 subunit A [Gemmataceae bacterium]